MSGLAVVWIGLSMPMAAPLLAAVPSAQPRLDRFGLGAMSLDGLSPTGLNQYSTGVGSPTRPLIRAHPPAQDSGLAGSHPAYELRYPAPLNRLVNAAQQTANYNRSCPSSYPRPAGLSCDEYPFRSSRQGASTGGGPGRTIPGCQVPLPSGTGPIGYSACMIDDTENSEGGSALGSFYIDQRILDNDAYYVWIKP